MKQYFQYFPLVFYDDVGNGELKLVTLLLERVRFRDVVRKNNMVFYPVTIQDGESPESMANKYYGAPGYHWIILLANNILNVYEEWPTAIGVIDDVINIKYKTTQLTGLQYAYQTIHHYQDFRGNVIDYQTFLTLQYSQRSAVTVYDYEIQLNENKRQIQLLDKSYVPQVLAELQTILYSPIIQ